jgi:hypothetical protein
VSSRLADILPSINLIRRKSIKTGKVIAKSLESDYIWILVIKDLSYGGSNFWTLIVDNYTDYA